MVTVTVHESAHASASGGDPFRKTFVEYEPGRASGSAFEMANLGKASVVIDLKAAEGKVALMALLQGADVLVTVRLERSSGTLFFSRPAGGRAGGLCAGYIGKEEGGSRPSNLEARACSFAVWSQNLRVDALRRLGLDSPTLTRQLPHLVYCGLTAYGTTGPDANAPGVRTPQTA